MLTRAEENYANCLIRESLDWRKMLYGHIHFIHLGRERVSNIFFLENINSEFPLQSEIKKAKRNSFYSVSSLLCRFGWEDFSSLFFTI